jgi:hypothetical protein
MKNGVIDHGRLAAEALIKGVGVLQERGDEVIELERRL